MSAAYTDCGAMGAGDPFAGDLGDGRRATRRAAAGLGRSMANSHREDPRYAPGVNAAPKLRLARVDEIEAIDALMKAATRDLFPGYHDAEQTEATVDEQADPMTVVASARRVHERPW